MQVWNFYKDMSHNMPSVNPSLLRKMVYQIGTNMNRVVQQQGEPCDCIF